MQPAGMTGVGFDRPHSGGGISRWPCLILAYHRVAELDTDPQLLAVKPANFAAHLEVVRRRYQVLSLDDLAAHLLADRPLERPAVVLTFDDGYADNLYQAAALAGAAGLTMTVFAVAAAIGSEHEFWWDELERILLMNHDLPPSLELSMGGEPVHWTLAGDARWSPSQVAHFSTWNVTLGHDPTPRHVLYRELSQRLRPLTARERGHHMAALRAWAGLQPAGRFSHRALNAGELRRLAASEGVTIGAHTLTHPVLARLSREAQFDEIHGGRRALEAIIGQSIDHFSYPYGTRADFNSHTLDLVIQEDFISACANFPGAVRGLRDRFRLPRFLVRDWTATEMEVRLNAFAVDAGMAV